MRICIFLSIALLGSFIACDSPNKKDAHSSLQQPADIKDALHGLDHTGPKTQYEYTRFYEGKIGNEAVQMELNFWGKSASGRYFFPSQSQPIFVEYQMPVGNYRYSILKSYDDAKNHIGTFQGFNDFDNSFEGIWVNSGGTEELTFSLREDRQVWYVDGPNQKRKEIGIRRQQMNIANGDSSCRYSWQYPVFSFEYDSSTTSPAKINEYFQPPNTEVLAKQLKSCSDFYKKSMKNGTDPSGTFFNRTYKINLISNQLMSVNVETQSYQTGDIRPENRVNTLNLNIRTGEKITHQDLFIADYAPTLNQLIEKKFEELYGHDWGMDFEGISPHQDLEIYSNKLVVSFDAYELGEFAPAPIEVEFSYDQLAQILLGSGPLPALVK